MLVNARVLTMDPRRPSASTVVIIGNTIAAVGDNSLADEWPGNRARTIDCQGLTLIPGLIDSHCHILAQAAAMQSLDCGPDSVSSISELTQVIRQRAAETPAGGWIRGYGYDDTSLAEVRHPTRWDLDTAAPDHPVRLNHRSGHASVLNSLGLTAGGYTPRYPGPARGDYRPGPGHRATHRPTPGDVQLPARTAGTDQQRHRNRGRGITSQRRPAQVWSHVSAGRRAGQRPNPMADVPSAPGERGHRFPHNHDGGFPAPARPCSQRSPMACGG